MTIIRIMLTPFIVMTVAYRLWGAALALCICAAGTDLLDGYIARAYNQESKLGRLLDPVADKILLVSVMGMLLYQIPDTLIKYTLLFCVTKELVLLLGAYLLHVYYGVFIQPSRLSRLASLLEFVLFFVLILWYNFCCFIDIRWLQVLAILLCVPSILLLVRYGIYIMQLMRKKV